MRGSLGLLGRLFAILLLTVLLEFAVGTLIYERSSQLYLQDDEARRLAAQEALGGSDEDAQKLIQRSRLSIIGLVTMSTTGNLPFLLLAAE